MKYGEQYPRDRDQSLGIADRQEIKIQLVTMSAHCQDCKA